MNKLLSMATTPLLLSFTLATLFFTGCSPEAPDNPLGPKITAISPTAAGGGDTVTLYGKNLLADLLSNPKVTINNKLATIVLATNDSFKVVIPKKCGSGPVALVTKMHVYTGPGFTYNYQAVVTTIAGTGAVGANDGAGSQASFNFPWGITVDLNGDLYVAECYGRRIRKILATDNSVSTIEIGYDVEFYSPDDIALDVNTHTLYLTDFNAHILKVPAGLPPTVIYKGEMPLTGIAIGPDHHLYVSNNSYGYILKMDTSGQNSSFFASGLMTPRNIIFDKAGYMYVPAYSLAGPVAGSTIHKIDPAGNIELVVLDTTFQGWEIARDTLGNFYEADHFSNRIRKIDTNGNITTIAGNGIAADIDGTGLNASFDGPTGITIDQEGNLYVTTYNLNSSTGNKVRKIAFE